MAHFTSIELFLFQRAKFFPSSIVLSTKPLYNPDGELINASILRKARILRSKGYVKMYKRNAMGSPSEHHRDIKLTYKGLGYADRIILQKYCAG